MHTLIALFRGINVGGHNKLPMQALRDILEALDCCAVRTYIQSGNAVFRTSKDPARIGDEIAGAVEKEFGFAPGVLILTRDEVRAIAAANPYSDAEQTPAQLHVSFLAETPTAPDLETLKQLRTPTESFTRHEDVFDLHAPDGIGRSKLAARVEKSLGVEATGRNWRTVEKILALADEVFDKS